MGTPEDPNFLPESYTEPSATVVWYGDIRSDEDIRGLGVGTVIEIYSLGQFGRVAEHIAKRILLDEAGDDQIIVSPLVRTDLPERLRRLQRSGGFWGDDKTENNMAIIIPTDRSIMDSRQRDREDMRAMSFLAVRDIISTKGGNRGPVSTTCTVYGKPVRRTFVGRGDQLMGNFAVATHKADHNAIRQLLQESKASRLRQLEHAIRFAYPAGIPGLGK